MRHIAMAALIYRQGWNEAEYGSLASAWGYRRASFSFGLTMLDPKPQVRREFKRVKELGMTKAMGLVET